MLTPEGQQPIGSSADQSGCQSRAHTLGQLLCDVSEAESRLRDYLRDNRDLEPIAERLGIK